MEIGTPKKKGRKQMKHYKLKDGTIIKEFQKGTWSIIFKNKRYVTVTTWKGHVEMIIPSYGIIDLGEITNIEESSKRVPIKVHYSKVTVDGHGRKI